MKTETLIFVIGVTAIAAWYLHNRGKADKQQTQGDPVVDPNANQNTVARRNVRENFKIVMPSDLVSQSVRNKARDLTNLRFSVDPNMVRNDNSLAFTGSETFMNKSGGGGRETPKESWKQYIISHLEQAGGGIGKITDANRSQRNRVFANLNQLAKDVKRL